MEIAKVTSNGQITIPADIRRRMNIKDGDKMLFLESDDGVLTEVHLWELWEKSRKSLLAKSLRDFFVYMCVRISIVNWDFDCI